jgi:hypothetical protein
VTSNEQNFDSTTEGLRVHMLLRKSLLIGHGIAALTVLIWMTSPGDNLRGNVTDWILFPGFYVALSLGATQIHDVWFWALAFILNGMIYGAVTGFVVQAFRVMRRPRAAALRNS